MSSTDCDVLSTHAISCHTVAAFGEHRMRDLGTATLSTDKTYTVQIAPSLGQAPFQSIAAQVQFLQLHHRTNFGEG